MTHERTIIIITAIFALVLLGSVYMLSNLNKFMLTSSKLPTQDCVQQQENVRAFKK